MQQRKTKKKNSSTKKNSTQYLLKAFTSNCH
jgi:hypothetical protein